MNTYVLGAGASRHAGYPLTGELGQGLLDWVRQNWANSILRLRVGNIQTLYETYNGLEDLERVLTEVFERPAGLRQRR
jgi:hypothetical protein